MAGQRDDPASILTLHRRLLRLRRGTPALHAGAHQPVEADGDLLVYLRTAGDARWLVALNLCSTHPARDGGVVGDTLELRGDEGVVVELG